MNWQRALDTVVLSLQLLNDKSYCYIRLYVGEVVDHYERAANDQDGLRFQVVRPRLGRSRGVGLHRRSQRTARPRQGLPSLRQSLPT